MKHVLRSIGTALTASLFATATWGAEGRHALIIGIGQYSEASNASALVGVPQDMVNARRIANEMGIPDSSIVMLRDEQATKSAIRQEFQKLADKVQPGDRVFIYHSGHGTRYPKGNSCLQGLQTYTPGKFMYDDILTEEEVASYTQPISQKADKVLVMIDACFSGGVLNSTTRSLSDKLQIRPKYNNSAAQTCENVGINQAPTRSLLSELKRLGIYEENFVQIAAARDNEVSWDNKSLGGLATHSLTQCLMGGAIDRDQSGAVSLEEIRDCAQAKLDEMMKPHANAGMRASTIQVRGNRNLIPVSVQRPPEQKPPSPLPAAPLLPSPPPLTTPVEALTETPSKPQTLNAPGTPTSVATPTVNTTPTASPILASLATLKDIEQQRDPRRFVEVKMGKSALKIGKDSLDLTIKSSHDGYVYLILLGSDAKSFYVLYPNGLDQNNAIKAGKLMRLPKPDWQIKAAGPVGTDNILVMIADSPRKLDRLTLSAPTANEPFTFTLNDIGGRASLINFLTGSGIDGRSESFGAKLISIKEVL